VCDIAEETCNSCEMQQKAELPKLWSVHYDTHMVTYCEEYSPNKEKQWVKDGFSKPFVVGLIVEPKEVK